MISGKDIWGRPALHKRKSLPFVPPLSITIGLFALFMAQAQAESSQIQVGRSLFQQYCFDCHGPQKDGMGRLRQLLEQEPANLNAQATQTKTDQELFSIIKHGGGVEMHGWADTFTDSQIRALVRYIRNHSE